MKTMKMNKSNWTGEKATIKLHDDGLQAELVEREMKFKLTETFRMKESDDKINIDIIEYEVEIKEEGCKWEKMDFKVTTDHTVGKGWHYATSWNGDYARESTKDVRLAVAKLIFNLV